MLRLAARGAAGVQSGGLFTGSRGQKAEVTCRMLMKERDVEKLLDLGWQQTDLQ